MEKGILLARGDFQELFGRLKEFGPLEFAGPKIVERRPGLAKLDRPDIAGVFPGPGLKVGLCKLVPEVDPGRDLKGTAGTSAKPEPAIPLAAAGQNEHYGPVAAAKDAFEGLFVD